MCMISGFFFFFKQKTAYEMRISDWSSDVCSSDLGICRNSMVVEEPVGFWETWSGKHINASGDFEIENGIVPVQIDMARNVGRYAEPNVWVVYPGAEAARAAA